MSRQYNFELPYVIGSFMLSMGWGQVHDDPLFHQLPSGLQQKISIAHRNGDDLEITRSDLDSIPDSIWPRVAEKFSLDWSEK